MDPISKPIRIDSDDNPLDIIRKINVALKEVELTLQDDDEMHEGFLIFQLVRIKKGK